jgi:hypothetical protein
MPNEIKRFIVLRMPTNTTSYNDLDAAVKEAKGWQADEGGSWVVLEKVMTLSPGSPVVTNHDYDDVPADFVLIVDATSGEDAP